MTEKGVEKVAYGDTVDVVVVVDVDIDVDIDVDVDVGVGLEEVLFTD